MTGNLMRKDAAQSIIELCRLGLDPATFRARLLPRLRRAVPVDALWWATADPATLLFTGAYQEEIPERTAPYFLENEFIADDVNKWVDVAHHRDGVRTLLEATGGVMSRSARYTEIFHPLGFGDELRAVFRVQGSCWGFMCLHREGPRPFSPEEALFVRSISPHVALAIRAGLVTGTLDIADVDRAPGVVLLNPELAVTGWTPGAEQWLEELGYTGGRNALPPTELLAVAARLRGGTGPDAAVPRLRVRTKSGRWAVLHASRLPTGDGEAIAVIIDKASAAEVAPIVMLAYGLSEQERTITGLVCQGRSTVEIAARARISANTVQDHLKSVFDKVGVRSRRELVVTIFREQYLLPVRAGRSPGPSGFFA
ncbi:MAG: helix-turn-helix domain-containing protein [Candidatus Dormibacter sp.]